MNELKLKKLERLLIKREKQLIKRKIISPLTPKLFDNESQNFLSNYFIQIQAEKKDKLYAKLISKKRLIYDAITREIILKSVENMEQDKSHGYFVTANMKFAK